MVKIFFPALGVYFSELCRLALPLCHNTVNKKNGGKWSQVRPALLHIILFISRLPIKKTTVFSQIRADFSAFRNIRTGFLHDLYSHIFPLPCEEGQIMSLHPICRGLKNEAGCFLFSAPAIVVLADEADSHLCLGSRNQRSTYH